MTDYLWFGATTDSAKATINTAAIISASSNLPTLEPDDVKKITTQWLGLREMEGIQLGPLNRVYLIKKKKGDNVALKLVLFLLNSVRH